MKKIKDRAILGIIAGLAGGVVLTAMDIFFLKKGIVKSSLRRTAATIYVTKKEANTLPGKILGDMTSGGFSIIGGLTIISLLTMTGTDHRIAKGLFAGVTSGSIVPALFNGTRKNKILQADAKSYLSYVLDHAIYGIVVVYTCYLLGDPSLFDNPFPSKANADK